MKLVINQNGLTTATNRRQHSYANVDGCGGARLSGMNFVSAHNAFVGAEPMT